MQTGPDAEVSFDGLVRLDRSNVGSAWVKCGIDLAHYNAVIVADPEFEFRTVQIGENRGSRSAELPLTQADKGSLIDTMQNQVPQNSRSDSKKRLTSYNRPRSYIAFLTCNGWAPGLRQRPFFMR